MNSLFEARREIRRALAFGLAFALASAGAGRAEEAAKPTAPAPKASAKPAAPAPEASAGSKAAGASEAARAPDGRLLMSYWLLDQFDWGDDEGVVQESVLFDPHYECKGTPAQPCLLVTTVVDGEQLLARFQQYQGGLWQVAILTPDLDRRQASRHLRRVWNVLVDYVTRLKGAPKLVLGLPALDDIAIGPPQVTHFWQLPGLEARVMVGRRDKDLFYVGVWFSDPVRGKAARDPWLASLAASDAKLRAKRAKQVQQKQAGPKP